MRRECVLMLCGVAILVAGCSKFERLSFVRQSAERGKYTQVAPSYDVSGKPEKRGTDPYAMLLAATDHLRRGELEQAERQARQVVRIDPKSADAQSVLGSIEDARGNAAAAGRYFQAAVTLAPQSGTNANNYGSWLCANGQAAASLQWFDRALADPAYPTPLAALANAGTCAHAAGQDLRAETSWRTLLASDPVNPAALSGMAALQYQRGAYMEARAFAERWLAVTPAEPAALRLAADIEQKLGDNAAASRYLLRLQAIPTVPGAAPHAQ